MNISVTMITIMIIICFMSVLLNVRSHFTAISILIMIIMISVRGVIGIMILRSTLIMMSMCNMRN